MVEITEPAHAHEVIEQQTSDAQWIEVLASYFVTQQHVMITTPTGTTKESVVVRMTHNSVTTAAIYGANQQTPFASIESVRRVGAAELAFDPRITRGLDQFAGYMARGEEVRLEMVNGVIEKAIPCWLALSGVTVIDSSNNMRVSVSLGDIKQVTAAQAPRSLTR